MGIYSLMFAAVIFALSLRFLTIVRTVIVCFFAGANTALSGQYAIRISNSFTKRTLFKTLYLVAFCLGSPSFAASPNGASIPPASQVVDSNGGVWTVDAAGLCYLNGVQAGNCNSVGTLLLYNGSIYVGATYGTWWVWNGSGWAQVAGDPSPASPNGATIPSAAQIVDPNGGVWTVNAAGLCYLNGVQAGDCNSVGTLLLYNGSIYVGAKYGTWWVWNGSGWAQVGGDPRASTSAAPTDLEPPVISGTAQAGKVLASTTGTWTGAASYAYQWAGNGAQIAGATASTYTPVASDVGHTLTSTVTATGSGGSASATSAPSAAIVAASSGSSSSGSFVALHTYYISPTGSDSNSGLTAATAWATPNHTGLVCGDVIIAAPGAYNTGFVYWNNPSNCPSTSGGIDGNGGIYFAVVLCGGAHVGDCSMNFAGNGMIVNANNWAIEGWQVTSSAGYAFLALANATNTTIIHHVAFINDIASNSHDGFVTGDGGKNHNVPGNGVDQFAVVGDIAYNSNQDPICVAAIDDAGPANYD